MNPSDLRSRLDSIKKQEKPPTTGRTEGFRELQAAEKTLLENGWLRLADMVYEKTTWFDFPLDECISDFLIVGGSDSSNLYFYDTETTGLGGAGNIVFLTGFGFKECGRFKIVQLMLTDFPGEPAFLEAMRPYISPDKVYVSYNGRSFDANILQSRYALNGLRIEFGYQLDLLYPARRLWRNVIGSCSLADIEKNILGKERGLDVPGSMVPDLYFDFIRSGEWASIEAVAAHHLEDIESLAGLLSVFERIFREPLRFTKIDRVGLASQLAASHPDASEAVLKAGYEAGSFRSSKEYGLMLKRNEEYQAACEVWTMMWESRRSIFAGLELAKHFEHREKNITRAHSITCELLALERIKIRPILAELEKRRARLENKIVNSNHPQRLYPQE